MAQRTVDMVEPGGRVVVRHTFYGDTAKEARHNERSHLKADKSLSAAERGKSYQGVKIRARRVNRGAR